MQFTYAAVVAFMATAVSANYGSYGTGTAAPVYTTEVVTAYTTYCPYATQVTMGGKTYTVTEATTLTITDCPCTVSKPVYVTPIVYCNTCSVPAPYSNSTTTTHGAPAPIGTGSTTTAAAPVYSTGAGNQAVAGLSGLAAAAMLAVLAL